MPVSQEMVYAGLGARKAQSILGRTTSVQTAAGTDQETAAALIADNALLTTVGAGTGVVLPTPDTGDEYRIANGGANSLFVYPQVGAKLNNQTANSPLTLPAGRGALFVAVSRTDWICIFS